MSTYNRNRVLALALFQDPEILQAWKKAGALPEDYDISRTDFLFGFTAASDFIWNMFLSVMEARERNPEMQKFLNPTVMLHSIACPACDKEPDEATELVHTTILADYKRNLLQEPTMTGHFPDTTN